MPSWLWILRIYFFSFFISLWTRKAIKRRWLTPRLRQARIRRQRAVIWQREVSAITDPVQRLQSATALLRSIALADHPPSAQLQGQDWLRLLEADSIDPADRGWVDQLAILPFQPDVTEQQVTPLIEAMRKRAMRGFL